MDAFYRRIVARIMLHFVVLSIYKHIRRWRKFSRKKVMYIILSVCCATILILFTSGFIIFCAEFAHSTINSNWIVFVWKATSVCLINIYKSILQMAFYRFDSFGAYFMFLFDEAALYTSIHFCILKICVFVLCIRVETLHNKVPKRVREPLAKLFPFFYKATYTHINI